MMGVGQFCCEVLNFMLKRIFKEERPPRECCSSLRQGDSVTDGYDRTEMNGKGYGMPSSHAQFLFYFATSVSLFLLLRHKPPAFRSGKDKKKIDVFDPAWYQRPLNLVERLLLSCLVFALAASVAWSRTYLQYHTPRQVLVGCGAGLVVASAWFVVTSMLRREGWTAWGCDTWLGQALRLRDLVVEEDFAEAGWQQWCARRQAVKASTDDDEGRSKKTR